jgi:hypothetical protein
MKKGVNTAISYLNSFHPILLIPDKLFQRAGCDGKLSSLERNLRRAQKVGKVKVEYLPNETGTDMIAHYQGVPGWIPVYTAKGSSQIVKDVAKTIRESKPALTSFQQVYFYQITGKKEFSPYFIDIDELHKDAQVKAGTSGYKLYTGSHDKPVEAVA